MNSTNSPYKDHIVQPELYLFVELYSVEQAWEICISLNSFFYVICEKHHYIKQMVKM
jgi:hypothetical protein